ncbi:MAG: V-type ATP synthase subunit F [Finegoldia sp.]|nr:V-type ATP synthase subunit F [Finegoldia sp.]
MRAKLLSHDPSLVEGFRLGGIEGKAVRNKKESLDSFNSLVKEEGLALIILTSQCYKTIESEVEEYRKESSTPLIVVIN